MRYDVENENCCPPQIYEHGEEIRVKISLINSSHKSVKHVKVTVQQSAQVNLFSTGKWKVCVASTNNRYVLLAQFSMIIFIINKV